MGEFFRGWRRKLGLVTLMMACALTGLWVRGIAIQDSFWFGFAIQDSYFSGQVQKRVTRGRIRDTLSSSAKDGIVWGREESDGNLFWLPGRKAHPTENNDFFDPFEPGGHPLNPDLMDFRWQLLGFEIGSYHLWKGTRDTYSFRRISHLSIVIPLTLISTCLLLSKPRKSTQGRILNTQHERVWTVRFTAADNNNQV